MNFHRVARQLTVVVAAGVCGVPRLFAQGSNSELKGKLLVAGIDTLAVTVEQQGRSFPVATAIQSMRRVRRGTTEAWEQTYRWYGQNGDSTADTLWYDASNLKPLENHRHNSLHDAVTVFRPSSAHTDLTPHGGAKEASDTTIQGPLYASGEIESIIRASPLRVGYKGQYNLYYGGPLGVHPASFEVVRSERTTMRNGEAVECWVVDAMTVALNTFWIDKKTRKLLKLVNHEDPTAAFVFRR
jgi:hypothetical protein